MTSVRTIFLTLFLSLFFGLTHLLADNQEPATIPYSCNFTDTTENTKWQLANGGQSNKWYIGNTTDSTYRVVNGLYISNDTGVTNAYTNSTTCAVYASRLIDFSDAGYYDIAFQWRAKGEGSYDYTRAFLVPIQDSALLKGGKQNGIGSGNTAYPAGWIPVGNKISDYSTIQNKSERINVPQAGHYFLTFYWKNDDSQGTNPPASIYNISINSLIDECFPPLSFKIDSIKSDRATFSWIKMGGKTAGVNILVSSQKVTDFSGVTPTVSNYTGTSYTVPGLAPGTYFVYMQGLCDGMADEDWEYKTFFHTASAPAAVPFSCDFTNPTENAAWTLSKNEDNPANQWHIGNTTTGAYPVTNGLYISSVSSNGASNVYVTNKTSYAYAFRGLTFSTAGNYIAAYNWRAKGEKSYDLLRAILVPEKDFLLLKDGNSNGMNGSSNGLPSGWIPLNLEELSLSDTLRLEEEETSFSISQPGVYYLTFFWKNDGSGGGNPPASVYNVTIAPFSDWCFSPFVFTMDTIWADKAEFSWDYQGGQTDKTNILISPVKITDFTGITPTVANHTGTSYKTPVSAPGTHYIYLQGVCSGGQTKEWKYLDYFRVAHPATTLPYSCDFTDATENASWTLGNDENNSANRWNIGSTTEGSYDVVNGLYISTSTNSASNTYSNTPTYTYAYRGITISDTGRYEVSFDWRANGERNYDLLRAFLVPANDVTRLRGGAYNGMSGSSNTLPAGWIALDGGPLQRDTSIVHLEDTFHISNTGVYYLTFFWKNDNSTAVSPAASVYNVVITALTDVSSKDIKPEQIVVLYPNPAETELWVEAEGMETIRILDLMGRIYSTRKVKGDKTAINVSDLPSGMYLLEIKTDKDVIVKKFIRK